jgi:hypothetical protein
MLLFGVGLAMGQRGDLTGQEDIPHMSTTSIPFRGTARGGDLILAETINHNMRVVIIQTRRGESAGAVASRLAQVINEDDPFESSGTLRVEAEGGTLRGLVGGEADYAIAGTESGLGIPLPPTALTCTYDLARNTLLVNWDNPPRGYDKSVVLYNWTNYDHSGGDTVAGNATTFVVNLDARPLDLADLDIWVIGLRKGIASNTAAIHVSGNALQELYGVPFTRGVMPNWVGWKHSGKVTFSQGVRFDYLAGGGRQFNPIKTAEEKPFYQILDFGPGGGAGAVYRRFKGLIPGHTYRVIVRLAVEDLDPTGAISVHACAHAEPALRAAQLAGKDRVGVVSGTEPMSPGGGFVNQCMELTLPPNAENLTVWVYCRTAGSARVITDYLSLEDMSP